jgi:hypothetical protein
MLTTTRHNTTKVGNIEVRGTNFEVADLKSPLSFNEAYNAIDFTKFGTLEGSFPNPTALDVDDFVSTRTNVELLAGSPRQVVFSKPSETGMNPGPHQITLRDKSNGQTATANLLVYSANAKLTQTKVASGTQTQLVVTIEPKELIGQAHAQIVNGPVHFTNGSNAMDVDVANGTATFPIQSQPGSAGQFDLSWWFKPGDHHKQPLKTYWWEPWKYKWWLWEPKKDPKNEPKGGDTKTLPPKWEPFVDKDEDGNVIREGETKTEVKDGTTVATKIYTEPTRKDGTRVTGKETITVKGDTRTTETTTTEFHPSGKKTDTTKTKVEKKDEKGEWKEVPPPKKG